MDAQIITVGNELLIGRTVDTNAAWLARRLDEAGFQVVRKVTIGDDLDAIEEAVRASLIESTVVVTTGGLGPTHDDVTKKAIARVFGVKLQIDRALESSLAARFERRGRPFTDDGRTMALVPEGFEWVANPVGTAPGLVMKMTEFGRRCLLAFPGVPYEMKAIYRAHAIEVFEHVAHMGSAHRTFRTAGMSENRLEEILSPVLEDLVDGISLAFLPDARDGVAVRLTARAPTARVAETALGGVAERVDSLIGEFVYGGEDDRLEAVVGRLLQEKGMTLSIAESCTGGLIADRITDVPGSSSYLMGGVVAYGNRAKVELLGVDKAVLASEGAVSKSVAEQMAAGCRDRFGSDVAISVTGVAGPSGGSPEKPVGTVWVGVADDEGVMAFHLRLTENRRLNKELAGTEALNILRRRLYGTVG